VFVYVKRQRKPFLPWSTLAIVVACLVLFFWLVASPEAERLRFVHEWGTVPTRRFDAHAPLPQLFVELRWLRLFTGLFIHFGLQHLVGNLLFLIIFGVPAERALGPLRFLLLFLLGGALANLCEAAILLNTNASIVGSSGAVSAIIGAYLCLFPRARLGLVLPLGMFLEFVRIPALLLIGFWFLLQIAFTFVGPALGSVAWWAHIAGFATGVLFALISRPAITRRLRM
jgi:membrane associated rhomboid family serine protease